MTVVHGSTCINCGRHNGAVGIPNGPMTIDELSNVLFSALRNSNTGTRVEQDYKNMIRGIAVLGAGVRSFPSKDVDIVFLGEMTALIVIRFNNSEYGEIARLSHLPTIHKDYMDFIRDVISMFKIVSDSRKEVVEEENR